jgi:hypothetical protein
LRASELFGVRFTDINFQTGVVNITRQLQNGVAMALTTDKSRHRVLGPAGPQVTLTVYADAWAAQVEQSAEGIADVLFGESGSKTAGNLRLWIGGPCRDRTYDQEIKSLLLYQLS